MDAFLLALGGGFLPRGVRPALDEHFGAELVDGLMATDILVPGPIATHYWCPRYGEECPRVVVESVGDPDFPYMAAPPGTEPCCGILRLTAEDVATWVTSRKRFIDILTELFNIRGSANLCDEVFPHAHRLGRAVWRGLDREVVLCTDLDGAAPAAYLSLFRAQGRSMLVLAHAHTRYTSPEVISHFGSGEVVVVFLDDELEFVGGQVRRRASDTALAAPVQGPAFCLLVGPGGERPIDKATYRRIVDGAAEELDLFLDLATTSEGSRHPTGRRNKGKYITDSLPARAGAAFAELVRSQKPLRLRGFLSLAGVSKPIDFIEEARRKLDVNRKRCEWRSVKLLRGEEPAANRYAFQPPEGLRWALLLPLGERG